MERILLVEDNESIVFGLKWLFEQEGFEAHFAKTVAEARSIFGKMAFDLVLLDVMLPDGDGFALCKWMLERADCPVFFLTAREEEGDVVKGFDLGAVDYVIKPFRNRELISRIRSALRRSTAKAGKGERLLKSGDLCLHTETGRMFVGDQEVALTKLELRILQAMLSRPGKIFGREEILAANWDLNGNYVNDNTLSVTMKRIREKIGDPNGEKIKTVRGLGYLIEKQGKGS